MLNTYRFVSPPAAPAAPAPAQPVNPTPLSARPDPSDASDQVGGDPQDLAAAIIAAGRNPQGSAASTAENLAAEALLDYARRSRMAGQADPSGSGGGQGGGGYGAVPAELGTQQPVQSLKPPGLAGALINMGLQAGAPQAQGFLPGNWLSGD